MTTKSNSTEPKPLKPKPLKPKPLKPKHGERRARILQTATQVFARQGFGGARLRDIGAEAGVNHQLIVHHFGNKEGLWQAVMSGLMTASARRTLAALAEVDASDPVAQLKTTIREIVRFASTQPEYNRILTFETVGDSPRLEWLADRHLRDVYKRITDMIKRGQAVDKITKGDPDALYFAIFALAGSSFVHSGEYQLLTGKDPFSPDRIEAVTQRCYDMLDIK